MNALVDGVEELINNAEKRYMYGELGYEFAKSHFDSRVFRRSC